MNDGMRYRSGQYFGLVFTVAAAFFLSGLPGCGDSSGTVPVSGRISLRGQPLKNASITFFPMTGRPVTVSILDGDYNTELVPGDYVLAVTTAIDMPQGYGRTHWNQVPPQPIELPAEHSSRATSKLKATVLAEQAEPISFDLQ
jgi:hypothetical protein